ncbi:MAG: GIY-YIG nuclease family protein [Phycisphaerae bacterium]
MIDSGVYIAVFYLPKSQSIRVGARGRMDFPQGFYGYVGSAQRNLTARIERHGRKKKPLRWHIDYLSVRARMVGAITMSGSKNRECRLAREVVQRFTPVPGFGASDCHCGSHLFYTRDFPI